MSLQTLRDYYVGLLIIEYIGKPRARATIDTQATPILMPQQGRQTVSLVPFPPDGGSLTLSYGEDEIIFADTDLATAAAFQAKLRTLSVLSEVVVTEESSGFFLVRFSGVVVAEPLTVVANTLTAGLSAVSVSVENQLDDQNDTMPLAVQNGFNLEAPLAVGKQLDIIGKYVGVSRIGQGFTGVITLSDSDFISLIRMAVLTNSASSDLSTIQDLIHTFFNGQMLVFDYQNMRMSYLISSGLGSIELIQMFLVQGLLPRPMAVQVSAVVYAPVITEFFGFVSYELPTSDVVKPFNDWDDYRTDWPWLSYANAVVI